MTDDRELETLHALALEAGQIGLWSWDAATDIIEWDARTGVTLGVWSGIVTPERFDATIHPDDVLAKRAAWTAALDPGRGGAYRAEYRIKRPDNGRERWVSSSGRAIFTDGKPVRMVGVMRDVSERRGADAELRQAASLLAGIVSIAADAILSIAADQCITLFNDGAQVIFGYDRDEVIGQSLTILLPEHFRSAHDGHIRQFGNGDVQARRMGERGEIMARRKNGDVFPAEASISKLDVGGRRIYTAVLRDMSERNETARQLQHGKKVLEIALDAGHIGLFESNHAKDELFWSPIFRHMLGVADDLPVSVEHMRMLVHPEDRQRFVDAVVRSQDAVDGGTLDVEFRIVRPDGEPRWLQAKANISFRDGHPERTVGAVLDITERRQSQALLEEKIEAGTRELKREMQRREASQAQLVRTQRMEAFGQLTGGIAHDFNNLLTVITGNLELLEMRLQDEKERALLKRAQDASEMGARLTGRLLTFARRRTFETTALNLNEHVIGMAELLERTLGEPITLTTVLERAPWTVLADGSEIENAILNLAINARDAMPDGGKLIIQTSNVAIEDGQIGGEAKLLAGDYVRLSLADTGVGMAPEVLQKAFEPFFTTKEPGKGTGLGLSTIYGFAQQARGAVTIYSEVGRGTTVNLYLPRADQPETVLRRGAASADVPDVTGTSVLLVEDNPDVRHVTKGQLEILGYLVTDVASGPAAIELLSSGRTFRVVLSDVVMAGGLSGFDVARWVRNNAPDTAVLLASGYPDEVLRQQKPDDADFDLLRKPYSRSELAHALRRVLDEIGTPTAE